MLEQIKKENQDYLDKQQDTQSSYYHHLKLKDLRKLVANTYTMDENTPVLVERIEDKYFEQHGWSTYKGLNQFYHQGSKLREDLKKDNWMEDYPDLLQEERDSIINETESDYYTDQFYAAWCVIADKENKIIKIHSHY